LPEHRECFNRLRGEQPEAPLFFEAEIRLRDAYVTLRFGVRLGIIAKRYNRSTVFTAVAPRCDG